MSEQAWLWVGFVGMAVGAAFILAIGRSKTPNEGLATILHGIVPIIAACSYFAMAVGQGSVVQTNAALAGDPHYNFYFARYIDWAFTTPLLLASLASTAMHTGLRKPGLLVGIVLSDVIMIVTALFFGLSSVAWVKWSWFGISCGAFLAVYYLIWDPLRAEAERQREDVRATYRLNASILSVIWLIYPIVLLVDPEGLGLVDSATSLVWILVLDLLAKVAYGLFSTRRHGLIADADVDRGASPGIGLRESHSSSPMAAGSPQPAARGRAS